jgi:RND superfamily putative drug exporter
VLTGRRGKWVVLAVWVAIAGVAGQFAGKLAGAQTNEPSAYLPRSAESTQVLRLSDRFPGGQLTPAVVVYRRAGGLTAADRGRVAGDVRSLRRAGIRDAVRVTDPVPSRDGTALLYSVVLSVGGDDTALETAVQAIRRTVGDGDGDLQVAVTGPAGFSYDAGQVF